EGPRDQKITKGAHASKCFSASRGDSGGARKGLIARDVLRLNWFFNPEQIGIFHEPCRANGCCYGIALIEVDHDADVGAHLLPKRVCHDAIGSRLNAAPRLDGFEVQGKILIDLALIFPVGIGLHSYEWPACVS